MKFLVIDGRGRGHSLVSKLCQSPLADEIYSAPDNPGIAEETLQNGKKVACVPIQATDIAGLLAFAKNKQIDLTIVGPERVLALGIGDIFRAAGLSIFAPGEAAARFETSKCFAQQFARRHCLPFAQGECFSDAVKAREYARSLLGFCVVKKDGLSGGKGAFPCKYLEQAYWHIGKLLEKAGERIVIQELLDGPELSLQILCDGKDWKVLPTAVDYKRMGEGNTGDMTGGVGSMSPHPFVSEQEAQEMARSIMAPFLRGCAVEGILFQGLLYAGIILTSDGAIVIEFNTRFGDPETQAILPRLKTDLAELLLATAAGRLADAPLEIYQNRSSVCVVLAAPGYPQNPVIGKKISGLERLKNIPGVKVFHSSTRFEGTGLVTDGGRIVGATAWKDGPRLQASASARLMAYSAARMIQIEGGYQMRHDIGAPLFHLVI